MQENALDAPAFDGSMKGACILFWTMLHILSSDPNVFVLGVVLIRDCVFILIFFMFGLQRVNDHYYLCVNVFLPLLLSMKDDTFAGSTCVVGSPMEHITCSGRHPKTKRCE